MGKPQEKANKNLQITVPNAETDRTITSITIISEETYSKNITNSIDLSKLREIDQSTKQTLQDLVTHLYKNKIASIERRSFKLNDEEINLTHRLCFSPPKNEHKYNNDGYKKVGNFYVLDNELVAEKTGVNVYGILAQTDNKPYKIEVLMNKHGKIKINIKPHKKEKILKQAYSAEYGYGKWHEYNLAEAEMNDLIGTGRDIKHTLNYVVTINEANDKSHVIIQQQYRYPGKNLHYLKADPDVSFSEKLDIMLDAAKKLKTNYHDKRILHLDLKLDNIIGDKNKSKANIIDHDLAQQLKENQHSYKGDLKGTALYIAPETLHADAKKRASYNYKFDVYSYGISLLYFLCPKRFIDENKLDQQGYNGLLAIKNYRENNPLHETDLSALNLGKTLEGELRGIIRDTTNPSPKRRPTVAQVVVRLNRFTQRYQQRLAASAENSPFKDFDDRIKFQKNLCNSDNKNNEQFLKELNTINARLEKPTALAEGVSAQLSLLDRNIGKNKVDNVSSELTGLIKKATDYPFRKYAEVIKTKPNIISAMMRFESIPDYRKAHKMLQFINKFLSESEQKGLITEIEKQLDNIEQSLSNPDNQVNLIEQLHSVLPQAIKACFENYEKARKNDKRSDYNSVLSKLKDNISEKLVGYKSYSKQAKSQAAEKVVTLLNDTNKGAKDLFHLYKKNKDKGIANALSQGQLGRMTKKSVEILAELPKP